jgi:hypothetical protein
MEFVQQQSPASLPPGLRIVCISDTHTLLDKISVPEGDVLIHAGDFTRSGKLDEIQKFRRHLDALPHPYKLFIAGNHDLTLDTEYYVQPMNWRRYHYSFLKPGSEFDPNKYSADCLSVVRANSKSGYVKFLHDERIDIPDPIGANFVKIYGTAWQPEFCNMGFNLPIGSEVLLQKYKLIPNGVDILVTHTPPFGILDSNFAAKKCGCVLLEKEIKERIKPRIHIFGHIHEAHGKLM